MEVRRHEVEEIVKQVLNNHAWGPALPGQGSQQVCKQCGARKTTASIDPQHPEASCKGPDPEMAAQVYAEIEYDPI
jgi:hypothetical protein